MVINGIGIGIGFGSSELELELELGYKKYLTIEALEDDLTVSLSLNDCEYCVDEDNNWKTLSVDTPTQLIQGKLYLLEGI